MYFKIILLCRSVRFIHYETLDILDKEVEDAIRDIRETAEEFGRIMSMTAKSGHAYIEFGEASEAQEACAALRGKHFDEKIVFALFYPISLWNQKIYI